MASPNSYKDPYWVNLSAKAEERVGLPPGLLQSIVLKGERSNKDQISEAGARTVYQIIPSTRKAVIDKYGIDPYLNDELAAESAARLIKESLDRNKGDIKAAVAEYHGGTNRKNWGPKTHAYIDRVVGSAENIKVDTISNDFDQWASENGFSPSSSAQIEQVKQISNDLDAKAAPKIDENILASEVKEDATVPDVSNILADFDTWQAEQPTAPPPKKDLGFFGGIKEAFTGEQRATEATRTLPEWTSMPELNELSMASAKTGLGTIFAAPDEIVQVIQANYPNTQIRKDEKGNYIIKSSVDGADYVIPPGFSTGDIPRAIGGVAAFTPAGRATSLLGSAAAAGATQAAIETSQAATGGTFSPQDVAATAAIGGVVPPIIKGVKAVADVVASPVRAAASRVLGTAADIPPAAPISSAPIKSTAAAPQTTLRDVVKTTTKAAQGGRSGNVATQELAELVAPDAKVIEAAKRLDILDYLQPDHVSTNQVFRDISQAVKTSVGSEGRAIEIQGLEKVAKRADEIIETLGGTDDFSTVSHRVKQSLQNTQTELDKRAEDLYAQLKKGIGTQTPVKPDNVLNFVKQQEKDVGGYKNLSKLEKEVISKLNNNPTYALLDKVRKDIGSATRGKGIFKDEDTGLAKKLYSLINQDQRAVAATKGVEEIYLNANRATQLRKGIEDDLVALFGRNIDGTIVDDINKSVNALSKGDVSKFINLIKSVPEDMRKEVVASGLNTAFGKTAKQGTLNFNSYAHWYEGLTRNKQAYVALMTNLPSSARKSLSDLYRVSSGIAKASKERIPTGRVQTAEAAFKGGETLAGKIYQAAKQNMLATTFAGATSFINPGLGAVIGAALAKGAKPPAIQMADKLIASPEFRQAVLMAAKGQSQDAAKRLAKSKVFSDFVFKLKDPTGLSNRERWILQSLEANSAEELYQVNSR